MAIKIHPSIFVHPGVWLYEEMIIPLHINISELAKNIHVSRQTLSALLHGRTALSVDMAYRLQCALGVKASILLAMAQQYDLAKIEMQQEKYEDIKKMTPA